MDKYRIRLRRPGSHRLPETGVTDLKQVAAVDRFSCAHPPSPHFLHVLHIKADPCQNLFTCNQKDCNMF